MTDVALEAALDQLEAALAQTPRDENLLSALDALLRRAPKPSALVPLSSTMSTSRAALHARALFHEGALAPALELLLDIAELAPEAPYLSWALSWPASITDAEQARIADKLLRVLRVVSPEHTRTLRAALALLLQVGASDARLVGSAVARRIRALDLAEQLASSAHAEAPSWLSAVELALAKREAGDLDGASAWFERARALAPDEPALLVDLADLELDRGHFERARELYTSASADEWVNTSLLACDWLISGSSAPLALLCERAAAGEPRALSLASAPFVAWLPEPDDGPSRAVQRTIGELEACAVTPWRARWEDETPLTPSLQLVLSVAAARAGAPLELELAVTRSDAPRALDADRAVSPWLLRGHAASAALTAPSLAISEAIAEIAASDYALEAWAARAEALGRELGPQHAEELLAGFVHIPILEASGDALAWVARVQLVTALALAGIDDGWDGSLRRSLLVGLALAVPDWTSGAAALALATIAKRQSDAAHEIEAVLTHLLASLSPAGFAHSMTCAAYLELPMSALDVRRKAWRERRRSIWLSVQRPSM